MAKPKSLPQIRTARLLLREPVHTDVDAICALANDWEVVRWLARLPYPYTRADALFFLQRIVPREPTWLILSGDTDKAVGAIGLTPHRCEGTAVFGYWLGQDHWCKGFATEAGRAVVDHAFATASLRELISGCFIDNARSARVLEKLGFAVIGQSRQSCMAQGKDLPHVDMALTSEVWAAREKGDAPSA